MPSPKLFYRLPDNGKHRLTLKGFAVATLQDKLDYDWAKVGSWQTRLSPTFREPSANLSRISRL